MPTSRLCLIDSALNSFEVLGMKDTRHVALIDALKRQGGNQGGADTATVLGSQDFNGILFLLVGLLGPVENLSQSLGTTLLEVGVLVEHGTVSTDVARLVLLLLADSSNATGREAGSSCADELGGSADKLKLRLCALQVQLLTKEVAGLGQVLPGVPKNIRLVVLAVSGYLFQRTPR